MRSPAPIRQTGAMTTAHEDSAPTGEAGLLARMLPLLGADARTEVGPGDDAAVLRLDSPRLVITTRWG